MLGVLLAFTAFLGLIACDGSPSTPDPTPVLPPRAITVTNDAGAAAKITVELATTPEERTTGLMHRSSMPEDRGMLFLFPAEQGAGHGFWMRNTLIPLTIAYLDGDGRVLALKDGTPLDETILTPDVPYAAVLEMNQGWFQRHGMGVGSVVHLPDDAPEPR